MLKMRWEVHCSEGKESYEVWLAVSQGVNRNGAEGVAKHNQIHKQH